MEMHLFSVALSKGRFYALGSAVGALQTNLRYQCDATSLFVLAQALSTINFAATDDLHVTFGFKQD